MQIETVCAANPSVIENPRNLSTIAIIKQEIVAMSDTTNPPKRTANPRAEERIQELEIQLADAINAKERAVQQLATSEVQRVGLAKQFEAEMKKGFFARLFS